MRQLRDSAGTLDDIEALLRYLVTVNPRKIPDDIKRTLAGSLAPQTEAWMTTWAEQLREEGRVEGRKRVEELLKKTRRQTIVLLQMRFGELPEEVLRAIEAASEEQLFAWQIATDLAALTR